MLLAVAAWGICAAAAVDLKPNDTLESAVDTGQVDAGEVTVIGSEVGSGPLGGDDCDLDAVHVTTGAALPRPLSANATAESARGV